MSYLIAFVILANGQAINIPIGVFGSLQTCETARIKLIKDIEKKQKDATIVASCLDR